MAEPQTFAVKPKLKPKPKSPSQTPESRYWKSFKPHDIPNVVASVTSIDFSPTPPHDFAATFSTSLAVFNSDTFEPKTTISAFSDLAFSAAFRSDGKLVAAGGQSGVIQVFDVKTRSALRHLRGHSRPVRHVSYPRFDLLHLLSGGDDALVKYWDVVAEAQIGEMKGHKDYVRCGDGSPASSEIFATGSYDHTVRLWDARVSMSVMEINHGNPVEDLIFLPAGGLIASAGGNSVKIWDVMGGGKLVYAMESHNKTVTSICVGKVGDDCGEESQQNRLLSVGLDGYMKVFDYSEMKVTHMTKFPAPLLSIGLSPDCSTRVIGTSNGIIFAAKRKTEMEKKPDPPAEEQSRRQVLKPSLYRYFGRGQGEKPSEGDHLVARQKKAKEAEHDKLLRKFRHTEALVCVLKRRSPESVVAVMEELVARKKLLKCVVNLDMEELGLMLLFLQKQAMQPRFSRFLMGLAKRVIDIRSGDIRASNALVQHMRNLKRDVNEEIQIQESLQQIEGVISPLLRIAGRR